MDIGSILKFAGQSVLKEVPLGGLVMDVAEVALDKVFDRETVTGDDIFKEIESLPPEAKAKLLAKRLDTKARIAESHDALRGKMEQDTPTSRARSMIAIGIAVLLGLQTLGFSLMLAHAYVTTGAIPSVEVFAVVFGLPVVALLSYFGIDTPKFRELILQLLMRYMVRVK